MNQELLNEELSRIKEMMGLQEKDDACTRKVKSRYKVWPSAYACVPENTSKALTRYGWKHVDELNVGDEIMTYNIEKDELEFKPILNLHRYKGVKTNVVRSGNNGFMFEATDNHKWVVKLPEIKGKRLQKYNRINDKALIETSDLLINKSNKSLVVSAPYNGGDNVKLDEIFKYGTNWVKYILDITSEQRQAWLFSAIVYDGNQQKVERLTENINNIDDLNWLYTSPHGKQTFGFKQKDIEHRDAFLLSAFLNSGLVTWKKAKDKDIYSCHYTSNKPLKNTSNFKLVKENISDVWCPETENGTWVMMQETEGRGIITITGNSGALVKCRKVGASNWGTKSEGEHEEHDVEEANKTDYSKEKSQGLHGWFSRKGGGGSKGWVDCNTCRKNASGTKTCKACGRKDGEKRKYPACRPTPASCGTPKKGKKWGKKSNESLNEELSMIRGMMGLSESRIHITANEVPSEILAWARGKVGSNFSKNIVIRQESRVEIGMPWHEADREYWQFFQLGEGNSARMVGDGIGRSGLEGDGVVTGNEVDGYVNIPSGYVLGRAGTYPVRLEIFTSSDAMKPVMAAGLLDSFTINELLILVQAKGLKSFARKKFPDKEYENLIANGYLASNRSITVKGKNIASMPEVRDKLDSYAKANGMYFNGYELSKSYL